MSHNSGEYKNLYKRVYKAVGSNPYFTTTSRSRRLTKKLSKNMTALYFTNGYFDHVEKEGKVKFCNDKDEVIEHLVWIFANKTTKMRIVNWLIRRKYLPENIFSSGLKTTIEPDVMLICSNNNFDFNEFEE